MISSELWKNDHLIDIDQLCTCHGLIKLKPVGKGSEVCVV